MVFRRPRPGRPVRTAGLAFSSVARLRDDTSPAFKANVLVLAIGYALAGLASTAVLIPSSPVMAAEPAGSTNSQDYAISAGKLSDVLAEFAAAAGVQLVFEPQTLAGLHSDGLRGRYSVQGGFSHLLAGSGFAAVQAEDGAYSLRKLPVAVSETHKSEAMSAEQELPEVKVVSEVEVHARYQTLSHELPPEYAGGQVARGGRVGVLGDRDLFDTPFSTTNYTQEYIENRQAATLGDVLIDNPSVQRDSQRYGVRDTYIIRGFASSNNHITSVNGLFGLVSDSTTVPGPYERIELLKGPSAMLNGNPTGYVGGSINLVPKRATDIPVANVKVDLASKNLLGVSADLGRRFGAGDAFGVRLNALARRGDAVYDNSQHDIRAAALALDYRGDSLRASLDLDYQNHHLDAPPMFWFNVAPGVRIPAAPNGRNNLSQPWSFQETENHSVVVNIEYDLSDSLLLYAKAGRSDFRRDDSGSSGTLVDDAGTVDTWQATGIGGYEADYSTAEAGVRSGFRTGVLSHQLVAGLTYFRNEGGWAWSAGYLNFDSNLYDPVYVSQPGPLTPRSALPQGTDEVYKSYFVADTIGAFNDRLLLTLGGRQQEIDSGEFDAGQEIGSRKQSKFSPSVGVVIKATSALSLYANYIEALGLGPVAPMGTVNAGQVFDPIQSRQKEIGAKYNFGQWGATLALFEITQPSSFTDPTTNVFGMLGEQRNRGIEIEVFGEPIRGIRVLSGLALTEGTLTKTEGGLNNGKTAPGVPRSRVVLGGEWDLPNVAGLTLFGRYVYTSSQYYDPANTQSIPSWNRLDLGLRYETRLVGKSLVLRAVVDNVLDKRYFQSTGLGMLTQGAPRLFQLSASMGF